MTPPRIPFRTYSPEHYYPTGRYIIYGEHLRQLARNETDYKPPLNSKSATPKLDAIAVPTYRNRKQTKQLIRRTLTLAEKHGAGIVIFLCSNDAKKEHIAEAALSFPNQRWLAIDWQVSYEPLGVQLATTMSYLSRGKNFNVSEKRNFVLELAKLLNWQSVLFLDDDIEMTLEYLNKAAHLIADGASVVGFNVREFPDHSVVVHANQAVNSPIDSFMGTGALAVNTSLPFMSFFPNSYNNDWLFALLQSLTVDDGLVWAGTVRQKPYKPFRSPARAEREEPGDLLAEGLFRLVMDIRSKKKLPKAVKERLALVAKQADEAFWEKEITSRIDFIQTTIDRTRRKKIMRNKLKIVRSLYRSLDVINGYSGAGGLSAQNFVEWVQAWTNDLYSWNERLAARSVVTDMGQALEILGYPDHYLYGSGVNMSEVSYTVPHRHALYEFFKHLGNKRLDDAIYSHDNRTFMQKFSQVKGTNLVRIVNGADRVRYDRPSYDTGVKPAMTVVMFARIGESVNQIKQSAKQLAKTARDKAPVQLILWVYTDGHEARLQLERFRNLVASELLSELKGTNIMLASGVVEPTAKCQGIDRIIRDTSEDILITYWKLGRRPLPGHRFVIVNSRNDPLRVGTLRQLVRNEYGVPNKSLAAYVAQYCPDGPKVTVNHDKSSITAARERISSARRHRLARLRRYLSLGTTYKLIWSMWRSRLSLPLIDDLAQTIEFHDKRGWTSIHHTQNVLCVEVPFRQTLPGDVYGIARRLTALVAEELHDKDTKGCMAAITGWPEHTWAELQEFRSSVLSLANELSSGLNVTYSSLIYRSSKSGSSKQTATVVRALTLYIYWLENHRIRQVFRWHSFNDDIK